MEKTVTIKIQQTTADILKDMSKKITLPQYEIIDILLRDENVSDILKKGFEKKLSNL